MLTPLEIDAIGELFNLGLGAGTAALSEMTGRQIAVSVPHVSVAYNGNGAGEIPAEIDNAIAVSLEIMGDLEGRAVMYLPDESGLQLARVVHMVWVDAEELASEGPDFILSIGSEILQLCMTEIADQLQSTVEVGSPVYLTRDDAVTQATLDARGESIWLRFNFKVEDTPIHGHIAFNMTNQKFIDRVRDMVERLGG